MPSSRNRRRAQSQAQLSGRRRNRGGRRQRRDAAVTSSTSEIRTGRSSVAGANAATAANGASQTGVASTVETAAPEIRRRAARPRTPAEPLQMYPYLRSELTRIGALTGIMAVALVALTFVLG